MKKIVFAIIICILTMTGSGCEVEEKVIEPRFVLIEEKGVDVYNGKIEYISSYKYDLDGNQIWVEHTVNGISNSTEWVYENGKLVEEIAYESGIETGRSEVTCNKEGLPIHYHGDSYAKNCDAYLEYNEEGEILEYRIVNGDGSEIYHISYEYSDVGKMVRQTTVSYEGYYGIIEWEYDENGNISLQTVKEGRHNEIDYTFSIKPCYEAGRLIAEYYYDEEWKQLYYDEFFYDANGNLEKKVTNDVTGEVTYIRTYTYEQLEQIQ